MENHVVQYPCIKKQTPKPPKGGLQQRYLKILRKSKSVRYRSSTLNWNTLRKPPLGGLGAKTSRVS